MKLVRFFEFLQKDKFKLIFGKSLKIQSNLKRKILLKFLKNRLRNWTRIRVRKQSRTKLGKNSQLNKSKRKNPKRKVKNKLQRLKNRPKLCLQIVLTWVQLKETYQMHLKSSKTIKELWAIITPPLLMKNQNKRREKTTRLIQMIPKTIKVKKNKMNKNNFMKITVPSIKNLPKMMMMKTRMMMIIFIVDDVKLIHIIFLIAIENCLIFQAIIIKYRYYFIITSDWKFVENAFDLPLKHDRFT
jgi:hypothetical protein